MFYVYSEWREAKVVIGFRYRFCFTFFRFLPSNTKHNLTNAIHILLCQRITVWAKPE